MIDIFINDYNNVLNFLNNSEEFNIVKNIEDAQIVLWANSMHDDVIKAKSLGIPVVLVQHGGLWTRAFLPPLNFNYEPYFDKVFIWGKRDYSNVVLSGLDIDRVVITGCSLFEDVKKVDKINHYGTNISFFPFKGHADFDNQYNIIEKILSDTEYNLTVKLVRTGLFNIERYLKFANNDRYSVVYTDTSNILQSINIINNSDVMISTYDGTPSLIACIKDVPIVHFDCLANNAIFFSDIGDCISDINLLISTIDDNIYNKNKNINKRNYVAKEDIDLSVNSMLKIVDEIKKLVG